MRLLRFESRGGATPTQPPGDRRAPAPSGSRETAERLPDRNRDESVAKGPNRKAPLPGLFRLQACKPECPPGRSSGGRKAAQRRSDEEAMDAGTGGFPAILR